jgi:hypothetical protein
MGHVRRYRAGLAIASPTWVGWAAAAGWRDMLASGLQHGVGVLLFRLYEALPALILGRVVSFDAAGLYNQALR